jgi:methylmalonyl-CoA mutase C-terminal domain/subunit
MIAETALQEDADVVGLSILSGAHLELFPRVAEELKKRGMDDVVMFGGGIIPKEDIPALEKLGFKGIFGPGASTLDIVEWVRKNVPAKGAASRS